MDDRNQDKFTSVLLTKTLNQFCLRLITALAFLITGGITSNAIAGGVVTNLNDSGPGSLRDACATGGTVTFSPSLLAGGSATIVLNSQITIGDEINITGLINGADTLYISGNNSSRIFNLNYNSPGSQDASYFTDLVLINGRNVGSYGYGGAIGCYDGDLNVSNCVFRGNTGQWGGAIAMYESSSYHYDITVTNSTFENNNATRYGGAIYCGDKSSGSNSTRVTVNTSTIVGNDAGWGGGAIYCSASVSTTLTGGGSGSARVYIRESTIYNNQGSSAVQVSSSYSNSSANSAYAYIYVYNSTIYNNSGYGLHIYGESSSTIYMQSCILANNGVYHNNGFMNDISSGGYNIFSLSSLTGSSGTDQLGVNSTALALGPLGFNGGTTRTLVPLDGSVAIDNGAATTVDAQNGPIIGRRDCGAAEQTTSYSTDVITACGSYTWTDGITYTSSNNTATDTLVNAAGYDSIITLDLTIHPVYNETASASICQGDSYTFGTQTLTSSGNYTELFSSINGCDSTVNLTFTVHSNSASTDVISSCTGITWIDGITYSSSNNTATHTLSNMHGCDSIVTLNLTIEDVIAPVADLGTLPDLTDPCSINSLTAPTATDNCSGSIIGTHNASLPITNSVTITWTFDDGNGNTSTQTQNVIINDVSAPIADAGSLPDLLNQCSITSLTAPTATDNCAGSLIGTHTISLPITSSTTITWTYDDGNGNTSTQTQNVIINDVTAPTADAVSLLDLTDQCSITSLTPPTATDNCAGSIIGAHNASLPITSNTTITWTYDDGNGNTSTQTQNVIINDTTAPVADVVSLSDITTTCAQPVTSLTAPTATDNCIGSVLGTHDATLPIMTSGTTVVTWTYDDGSGNTSTQTQNVIINLDTTAPVPDVASLPDITPTCQLNVLIYPSATDDCAGTLYATTTTVLPITTQGTTVITWTYDDGNGNVSTQTQNVVIIDAIAPVANSASLPTITGECQIANIIAPTADDNCSGTLTGTPNVTFPITQQGAFTITWTYNDGNGNTSTQTQDVVINDVTAPVLDNAILTPISQQCALTSLVAPTATDNCSGSITGTPNVTFPITSSTTITWTYDDGNGNTSSQNQTVTITGDVTAPIADLGNLPDVTSECSVTSLTPPTATDNCSGTITGSHNASLPITTQGTTTVTWTYDDGNGNTSTQTQDIVINDITGPVADVATLADVIAECTVSNLTAPTATDNCSGVVTVTNNAVLPITTQGTSTITWTYDDGNGNTSTQTQNVIITDVSAPVADIANLADITDECEVTPTAPTATDNCAGTLTGTPDLTFPITASGTTVITWTYDDGNGNLTTQTQNIIITPIDNGITQVDATTLSADATGYNYQWIDCNNGNAPISGATNQSFTPATAGSYACQIDNGTCAVTTDCLSSTVGVLETSFSNPLTVYPNPTEGNLTIDLGDMYSEVTVTINNAVGQQVRNETFESSNEINLDFEGTPGVYILEVKTKEGKTARVNIIKM